MVATARAPTTAPVTLRAVAKLEDEEGAVDMAGSLLYSAGKGQRTISYTHTSSLVVRLAFFGDVQRRLSEGDEREKCRRARLVSCSFRPVERAVDAVLAADLRWHCWQSHAQLQRECKGAQADQGVRPSARPPPPGKSRLFVISQYKFRGITLASRPVLPFATRYALLPRLVVWRGT